MSNVCSARLNLLEMIKHILLLLLFLFIENCARLATVATSISLEVIMWTIVNYSNTEHFMGFLCACRQVRLSLVSYLFLQSFALALCLYFINSCPENSASRTKWDRKIVCCSYQFPVIIEPKIYCITPPPPLSSSRSRIYCFICCLRVSIVLRFNWSLFYFGLQLYNTYVIYSQIARAFTAAAVAIVVASCSSNKSFNAEFSIMSELSTKRQSLWRTKA